MKYKILVIDDEKEIRDLIGFVLRRIFDVVLASSGEEALKLIEKENFAVVLTDHWMEGITGIDILEYLHTNKPDIGRVLITGFPDLQIIKDAINNGHVHRFITKPWEVEELREIILEEVKRHDALVVRNQLLEDLMIKNEELTKVYEEGMFQKRRLEELNKEYKEQSQIAIELSEKFAKAHLELLNAQEIIERKNLELEEANKKLEVLSVTDGLTGFFNHKQLNKILEQEIGRAKRYDLELTCIMVDLDDFKAVNDNYGHLFGDFVLKTTSKIINKNIRETDFPARYGGDEFFIILPHTGIEKAHQLAKRIHNDIQEYPYVPAKDKWHKQRASIGLASLDSDGISTKMDLINCVDSAMYEAKKEDNSSIIIFDSNTIK